MCHGSRAAIGFMGIKDFVTGIRLYSSKGAAGRGWAVKRERGRHFLPFWSPGVDGQFRARGKCECHRGATGMTMERTMGDHSYDFVG